MVWYRVRTYGGAGCIVIIVLLLHLLFLIAWMMGKPLLRSRQHESEEAYMLVSLASEPAAMAPQMAEAKPEVQVPAEAEQEIDQTPFASLMPQQQTPAVQEKIKEKENTQKEKHLETSFNKEAHDKIDAEKNQSRETSSDNVKTVIEPKHHTIKSNSSDQSQSNKADETGSEGPSQIMPPHDLIKGDLPIPFLGVDTTQISGRDSEFHQFIKLVNKALYASMQQSPLPLISRPRPVAVRLVIVRTGRLAQTPTIIHSSGDPIRDQWYITMIEQAAASFPPIPASLRIPFIELAFREGMDRASPYR